MKPILYVVRHGETAMNVGEERIRGWTNVPLDEKGVQQGHQVARYLKANTDRVAHIYTGNLDRCRDTALIINEKYNAPATELMELRPWNLGDYNGQILKKVLPKLQYLIERGDERAPGGESFMDFVNRWINMFKTLLHVATMSDAPIIIVTHTRNIRVMLAWLQGGMTAVFKKPTSTYLASSADPVEPGDYLKVIWNGRWTVEGSNEG
jgi:broad specificity phosphatase PhoE